MRTLSVISVLFFMFQTGRAQTEQERYDQAFERIECMLLETCGASFKDAVFEVESAYLNGQLNKQEFDKSVGFLVNLVTQLTISQDLIYDMPDKDKVIKYAALFTAMTDTVRVQLDSSTMLILLPFTYDFDDVWGNQEWSNMFVSKLLDTKKGNCHSLPFLYKILAEEIGVNAHLAVAPNHFYIKHQSKASGWYNTELTSGIFPIDAWLMASGYIHLDAIVNRLYMEALNDKQTLAILLIDLAKGYERQLGSQAKPEFIEKCYTTTLEYYPHYINALLLQAEQTKKRFDRLMVKHGATHPSEIFHVREAQETYQEMTLLYAHIHELGYRKMPEEMYLNWLVSLKEERSKYENKEISIFKSQTN